MTDRTVVRARTSDDGPVIQVEVAEGGDPERDVGIASILSFRRFADTVGEVADAMSGAIRRAKPDQAEVEFGIDVGVESGELTALIVKGSGTATLTVRLQWTSSPARSVEGSG